VFNKKIGEWYGPQETCVAMQKCMDAFTSSIATIGNTTTPTGLPVGGGASLSIAMCLCDDGTVYFDRVHRLCSRSPSSPATVPIITPSPIPLPVVPTPVIGTPLIGETKQSPATSPSVSPIASHLNNGTTTRSDNVGVPFVSLGDPIVGSSLGTPTGGRNNGTNGEPLSGSLSSSSPSFSPATSPPIVGQPGGTSVNGPDRDLAASPLSLSTPNVLAATMTGSSVSVTLSARSPSPLVTPAAVSSIYDGTAHAANLTRVPVMEGDPLGVRPGPYVEPFPLTYSQSSSSLPRSSSPAVPATTTSASSSFIPTSSSFDGKEMKSLSSAGPLDADWRALLILIPVRLGVDRLNPDYVIDPQHLIDHQVVNLIFVWIV
jgi:hypothetical protein